MRFAVMQPYLFPYLGYYQLVHAVDEFVFYDDVTYIKGGYINRNNILCNGRSQRFTIPVIGMSSNKYIKDLNFDVNISKVLKTLEQAYRKAPFFELIFPIVHDVLSDDERNISHVTSRSISEIFKYLGSLKKFYYSSDLNYDREQSAADKLISISSCLKSKEYINSPGGKGLYDKEYFSNQGIKLNFIEVEDHAYRQGIDDFVPNLSIIDVLMWNDKEEVITLLDKYRLV
ncbi:WbqC family protein [Shewanella chilikensis]|uniref:WbqC family protein n=1 Tax=Shewanella chilikensis TaxID=558541 RepID=UPI00300417D3